MNEDRFKAIFLQCLEEEPTYYWAFQTAYDYCDGDFDDKRQYADAQSWAEDAYKETGMTYA